MADFCKQCSEQLFGQDFGDFKNLSPQDCLTADSFAVVLCEGCGTTQVDNSGRCIHHENEHHAEELEKWTEAK